MEFLNEYSIPVICGICLCVGHVLKKWLPDENNKIIPTVCALIGLTISFWMSGWNVTPAVMLQGLFSGLSATGLHQMFKQLVEGD